MLDEILARGLNADGLMVNNIAEKPCIHKNARLSDGWGYNYVSYLCYDMAVGKKHYHKQVEQTLRNLSKPLYRNYQWEGNNIDGFADSIEGCLYLLNRIPVPQGFAWADREMANNVIKSNTPLEITELWGTHKLESNGVRTVIMHALMHTAGIIARPWQKGLQLGASQSKNGLAIVIKTEKPYAGRLCFDIPRHRLYMGFKKDWPRMNTLPQWFIVEPDNTYTVKNLTTGSKRTYTGTQLHNGLPVNLKPGQQLRLLVQPPFQPHSPARHIPRRAKPHRNN